MFTLAQYVFGIGKNEQDHNDEDQQPSSPSHHPLPSSSSSSSSSTSSTSNCESSTSLTTSCFDSDSSQCVQTNIEDDWILIEVGDENSNLNTSARYSGGKKSTKCSNNKKLRSKSKSKNKKGEKWVVDPPECFINKTTQKDIQNSLSGFDNGPDSLNTIEDDSQENLLIEFPSNIVFESLFIKRDHPSNGKPTGIENGVVANVSTIVDAVAKAKKAAKKLEKNHKLEQLHNTANTILAADSANQNKAISVVAKGETKKRKKSITRKHHERQNRVNIQRNGPIIRGKKMFATLNGAYSCTRHQC